MKALIEIKQLNKTRRHTICFSKEARDLIDSKEIIIYNNEGKISIKRPQFETRKTYTIGEKLNTTYTCDNLMDIAGTYYITDDDLDFFELIKIEKENGK